MTDEKNEGYIKGYKKGYNDGYVEAMELAWSNVYHTLSHLGVELSQARAKVQK